MKKATRKKILGIVSGTLAILTVASLFGTLIYYNAVNKRIYNNYSGESLTEEELYELFKKNAAYGTSDSVDTDDLVDSVNPSDVEPSADAE